MLNYVYLVGDSSIVMPNEYWGSVFSITHANLTIKGDRGASLTIDATYPIHTFDREYSGTVTIDGVRVKANAISPNGYAFNLGAYDGDGTMKLTNGAVLEAQSSYDVVAKTIIVEKGSRLEVTVNEYDKTHPIHAKDRLTVDGSSSVMMKGLVDHQYNGPTSFWADSVSLVNMVHTTDPIQYEIENEGSGQYEYTVSTGQDGEMYWIEIKGNAPYFNENDASEDDEVLDAVSGLPKTGDSTNLALWMTALALSALGMTVAVRKGKKA